MEVLFLLHRSTHQLALWIEESLREEGVSHAEANILAFLHSVPDATINDAHRHLAHRRSTLTNLIDRLESRGLVARSSSGTSRRTVGLGLTGRGRQVASDVAELLSWLQEEVEASVSSEDMDGFRRVVAAVQEVSSGR